MWMKFHRKFRGKLWEVSQEITKNYAGGFTWKFIGFFQDLSQGIFEISQIVSQEVYSIEYPRIFYRIFLGNFGGPISGSFAGNIIGNITGGFKGSFVL